MERAARRRRGEVAEARPATGHRQGAVAALGAAEQREHAVDEPGEAAIEARPAGHEAPQRQALAYRLGLEMAFELALAPMAHQAGQRDAHRTDALAAAAEGRGVGQVARLLDADQLRRQ